jgi:CheY-like chemotaxis protein
MVACPTSSALEALAWIRQGRPFDIAVVDVLNSDMHGLTLVSEIRRYRDARTLPLIILDLLGQREAQRTVADGDYQAVLHKPLKYSQLRLALVTLLEGRTSYLYPLAKRAGRYSQQVRGEVAPRILCAEDDSINQQVTLQVLQKLGYQTEVVRNGALALEMLEQRHYDVVLLDVQMPELDGLAVARMIRRRWPADRQPYLIAVTANVLEGAREECLSAGMDDYIGKPIQIEELMKIIEMHRLRIRPSEDATARAAESPAQRDDAGADTRPAVDAQALQQTRQLLGEDAPQRLAYMIDRFLADTADLLSAMANAAALGDADTIQRGAHKLKSSSPIVGAMVLSELCEELEQALRTNTPVDLLEQVQRIETEFRRVNAELSA